MHKMWRFWSFLIFGIFIKDLYYSKCQYKSPEILEVVFTSDGHVLSPPSYISPWVFMDSDDPSTTFVTFRHGDGQLPVRAEVQVKSHTSGFIYPGVKSGYTDASHGAHGGVICMYNETHVRLYGAINNNSETSFIIYTGGPDWTKDYGERNTTGYARVRVWYPEDLPSPGFKTVSPITMRAGDVGTNYQRENHHLNVQPSLVVVQYTPSSTTETNLYGWTMEAQGSSSRPLASGLYWGGIVYGFDDSSVKLWAHDGSNSNYGVFSFCGGWGYFTESNCSFQTADVTIHVWTDLEESVYYEKTELHDTNEATMTGFNYSHEHNLLIDFDVDQDLITVSTRSEVDANDGYSFYGTGAAADAHSPIGGVVYAYTAMSVRLWHPLPGDTGTNGLTHVHAMGGTSNGISRRGTIKIQVWKRGVHVCDNVTVHEANHSSMTIIPDGTNCIVMYTCHQGYSHVAGNLTHLYNPSIGLSVGNIPICEAIPNETVGCCNTILTGINSNVDLTCAVTSCQATYSCLVGYTHLLGDLLITYNITDDTWNGTAAECYVTCPSLSAVHDASFTATSEFNVLGSTVSYICDIGYVVTSGDATRICAGNGVWTGLPPVCSAVTCPSQSAVRDASFTATTEFNVLGTIVSYTCDTGYVVTSGDATRICAGNGVWTGMSPVCSAIATISPPTTSSSTMATTVISYTTTLPTPTTEPSLICFNGSAIYSLVELEKIAEQIVQNFTVSKKSTSQYQRTLISVQDHRMVSKWIGVCGSVVCGTVIVCVVLSDAVNLFFKRSVVTKPWKK